MKTFSGGMQDWNYVNTNVMEVTVEMSCVKFPLTAELPQYWNDNKMSLISFIHEVSICAIHLSFIFKQTE